MGQGCAEQAHDPVAPELTDRALEAVNLSHQDPAAAVHDLVDVFRVELLRDGREPGHVGEHDRHQLALPLDGAAGGQNLVGQVFGGVRLGFGLTKTGRCGRDSCWFPQGLAELIAEFASWRIYLTAQWTGKLKFGSAFVTKYGARFIVGPTIRAFHLVPSFSQPI